MNIKTNFKVGTPSGVVQSSKGGIPVIFLVFAILIVVFIISIISAKKDDRHTDN